MDATKRVASVILVIAFFAVIFSAMVAVAGLGRDLYQERLKPETISVIVLPIWIAVALFIGLILGQFRLVNAARFLSRWGIWPAVLLSLINIRPASMLNWPLMQWPSFLIWFVPVAVVSVILGAREMRQQQNTA
jgi:hypothetical protein